MTGKGEAMEISGGTALGFRYGCIFGKTGLEKEIARSIERLYPQLTARPVRQIKHRSVNGVKSLIETTALPGYVFVSVPSECCDINLFDCARVPDAYRLLTDGEGNWPLCGSDRDFAQWIFEHDGLIGVSQAYQAGDRIELLSGPLKELEGYLVKMDRRGRNGLIEVYFCGQARKLWLAFDYTRTRKL